MTLLKLKECKNVLWINCKMLKQQYEMMCVCVSLVNKSAGFLEVQSRPPLQRCSSIADEMEIDAEREISLVPVTHVSQ